MPNTNGNFKVGGRGRENIDCTLQTIEVAERVVREELSDCIPASTRTFLLYNSDHHLVSNYLWNLSVQNGLACINRLTSRRQPIVDTFHGQRIH